MISMTSIQKDLKNNFVKTWDIVVCQRCGKSIRTIEGKILAKKFFVHIGDCK